MRNTLPRWPLRSHLESQLQRQRVAAGEFLILRGASGPAGTPGSPRADRQTGVFVRTGISRRTICLLFARFAVVARENGWFRRAGGWPSIRSKGLSSDTSPEAVRQHRWFASRIEDESHWRTRVNQYPVELTSFHQPSIRPLLRP